MLTRQPRRLLITLRRVAVASRTGRNLCGWDPFLVYPLAFGYQFRIPRDILRWLLCGEIFGEPFDLLVRQTAADAPHVFVCGRILAVVASVILELLHQIVLSLRRQPRKIRRNGVSIHSMAVRAHLLRGRAHGYLGIGQRTRAVERRASTSDRSQRNQDRGTAENGF